MPRALLFIKRHGIASMLKLPLSSEEATGLQRSAHVIHEAISSLDLDEQISLGKLPWVHFLVEQKEIV